MITYLSLLGVTFLSGSFVPLASEGYLLLLKNQNFNPSSLLLFATLGNTLGGMTCYWIAKYGGEVLVEKYLKIKKNKIDKWKTRLQSKGELIALLCWLPFVGEVIAAVLGFFELKWWRVFLFMALGKAFRYYIVLMI